MGIQFVELLQSEVSTHWLVDWAIRWPYTEAPAMGRQLAKHPNIPVSSVPLSSISICLRIIFL